MRRFLQALAMFLRRGRWTPPPTWTDGDARALASFLGTAAGRKLTATMRAEIGAANERAAMSRGGAFECGWACGYRGLLAWFEALGTESGADEAEETDGAGDDFPG